MINDLPKFTALFPMKANSQRVEGKNFKTLFNKPLYRWMLDTLIDLPFVERVVINTDATQLLDDDLLRLEKRIVLRERSPGLRGDDISMNRILSDDLRFDDGDRFLMTHATNPFLQAQTIESACREFVTSEISGAADSLFSVNRHQTRFYNQAGAAVNHDPANLVQTQDLEPWFEENSCLYLFTRQSFSAAGARIGERPIMFETERVESIDIDTPEDWALAEILAPVIGGQDRSAES